MARAFIVGALMFGCGAVAGVGVSSLLTTSESPEADASTEIAARVDHEVRDDDKAENATEPEAPAISSDAEVKRATEAVVSTVERAATQSVAALPRGDGEITGSVRDKGGVGVSGVTVRAAVTSARGGEATRSRLGRAMGDRPLETEIQNAVDGWQKKKSNTIETRTDGEGNYRFSELGAGPWTVSAEADGYAIEARSTAANIPPGAKVNFEAQAVTRVPLTVLLPDGRGARRVNIEVKEAGGNGMSFDLWTAEEPTVTVVPGIYQVRAILVAAQKTPNDYPLEAVSPKVRLDARTKGDGPPLELKLEPRHGIRGRVLLGDGVKIQQGCVALQQAPAGREPDLTTLSNNDRKEWFHSGSNQFEFLDLAPGTYVIGMMAGWQGAVLSHAVVKVESGVVEQDLTLDTIEGGTFLDVTLKGPNDEPLACQNFGYTIRNGGGTSTSWVQGIEQGPGRYLIAPEGEIKEWLEDSSGTRKLSLSAQTDTYGSKEVEVPHGTREIVFQFKESAMLDVVVVGYVGSGFEGSLEVDLERVGVERNFYSNESNLQGDGTAKFGPVEVGDYELKLLSFGENRWDRKSVATQKLSLVAGPNRATIAVPALYTVIVTVAGDQQPAEHEWLSIQGNDNWDNARLVNGRAEFKNLAPGEYTVQCQVSGKHARATFNVPDQLQVTLVPQAANAMTVNIQDESKYLKAAGFQNGDMIIGFDGVEFADENVMHSSFSTLIAKKSAKAIVLRGKQRLEIAIEPAKLLDPTQVGGTWWPTTRG
jgi:hypothetical protein